jgi:hypothetical protein
LLVVTQVVTIADGRRRRCRRCEADVPVVINTAAVDIIIITFITSSSLLTLELIIVAT